jgi:hypothetical protein
MLRHMVHKYSYRRTLKLLNYVPRVPNVEVSDVRLHPQVRWEWPLHVGERTRLYTNRSKKGITWALRRYPSCIQKLDHLGRVVSILPSFSIGQCFKHRPRNLLSWLEDFSSFCHNLQINEDIVVLSEFKQQPLHFTFFAFSPLIILPLAPVLSRKYSIVK